MKMLFLAILMVTTLSLTMAMPAEATAPVGLFVSTITTGNAPLTVQFVDASTNTPASWAWSFGDGGTSTEQNPSHTYSTAGTYTVTLTAINAGGSNTVSRSAYITVTDATTVTVANFLSAITSGTSPLTIQFADSSSNSPTSWAWSFGDGGTSIVQNPSHTYSSAGTYAVTLTATNAAGSNTISKAAYITVTNAIPVASFTSNVTSGTAPLYVQFTDISLNAPTAWTWVLGDGGSSTEQDPVYEYESAGTYTVTLTAENSAGSNMTYTSGYITVAASTSPVTSFTADVRKGTSPLAVQSTDTSTNTPTSWLWSFGDGSTSTLQNPSHTFAYTGSHTVKLTSCNAGGSGTTSASDYITVSPSEATQVITTSPTTIVTTIPVTTRTTAPVKAAPEITSLPVTGETGNTDSALTDLLIPAGIGLVVAL